MIFFNKKDSFQTKLVTKSKQNDTQRETNASNTTTCGQHNPLSKLTTHTHSQHDITKDQGIKTLILTIYFKKK